MYESFYGFQEKPFSLLPDPAFLFLGRQHSTALAMLQYGLISQAGFTVITGEIGCGKTTLIRYLLGHMDQDITVGLISDSQFGSGKLLKRVLLALGVEYRGKGKTELYQAFVEFLIGEYAKNRRTLLIIDEAQDMHAERLEELRTLSNVNADKDQVLQLILVGQPELRATLRRPDLMQFAQRIAVDYHLEPLGRDATREYIRHRTSTAGGDPLLFEPGACDEVYRHSGGIPRLINILCDTALVYGYGEAKSRIDVPLVREVAQDKAKGGLFGSMSKE